MKIRTRLLAAGGALALAGSVAVVAAPAGASAPHATITVNVHNSAVACDTLSGTLKFSTPLKFTGPTTGASTITVKGTVAGCTSADVGGGGQIFSGALAATINGTGGSNCTGLAGTSTNTNTATITWKPPKGYKFTPLTGSPGKPITTVTTTESIGTTFTVPVAQAPWASSYGQFQIGDPYGAAPMSITGANNEFSNGNGGADGWFNGVLQSGVTNFFAACSSTAGLKSANFGIGSIGTDS